MIKQENTYSIIGMFFIYTSATQFYTILQYRNETFLRRKTRNGDEEESNEITKVK